MLESIRKLYGPKNYMSVDPKTQVIYSVCCESEEMLDQALSVMTADELRALVKQMLTGERVFQALGRRTNTETPNG